MSNVFGSMFLPQTLTRETENLLKEWFPAYLTEIETREGITPGNLVVPTNYTQKNNSNNVPGEDLPAVVVLTPGLIGAPVKNGYGAFRGTWRLAVGVLVVAPDEDEAFLLAGIYGTAVMSIIEHNTSINGISSDTNLLDYSLDEHPVGNELRKFRSAVVHFAVDIDNMVIKNVGPKSPDIARGIANEVIITSVKNPV